MAWTQDHVHFKCSNYEATVRFSIEHFGATEEGRVASKDRVIVTLRIGDSFYKFSPKQPDEVIESSTEQPHFGVYHVGFKTDGLAAEVARMKAGGVRFTQDLVRVSPRLQAAFVEGPDGIFIELLQRG